MDEVNALDKIQGNFQDKYRDKITNEVIEWLCNNCAPEVNTICQDAIDGRIPDEDADRLLWELYARGQTQSS